MALFLTAAMYVGLSAASLHADPSELRDPFAARATRDATEVGAAALIDPFRPRAQSRTQPRAIRVGAGRVAPELRDSFAALPSPTPRRPSRSTTAELVDPFAARPSSTGLRDPFGR
ncbi:hypothetical protein ACNOYE_38385 [Nannocystaceae bacterium ST9]